MLQKRRVVVLLFSAGILAALAIWKFRRRTEIIAVTCARNLPTSWGMLSLWNTGPGAILELPEGSSTASVVDRLPLPEPIVDPNPTTIDSDLQSDAGLSIALSEKLSGLQADFASLLKSRVNIRVVNLREARFVD